MNLCGDSEHKERLIKRLHRIEGQVRGICGMVEDDRSCMEVIRQVASVSGAMRGVSLQVVGSHMKGCIKDAVIDGENSDKIVDELLEHLKNSTLFK